MSTSWQQCNAPEQRRTDVRVKDLLLHAGLAAATLLCMVMVPQPCGAQRTKPTAIRRAALQVGGGYSIARPDYSQGTFQGGSVYATFDFSSHLGVEFMFHQVNTRQHDQISERTYELGPRYVLHYRAAEPFVRVTYGRGVFNYPDSVANLAYNMFTVAGGADIRLSRHVYARGEYEVQRWFDFPPNGLQPTVVTVGAAYRF